MMPWGHFAVAYLPIALYDLWRERRLPDRRTVIVVLLATQLPDAIDKPLAWWFGILPSGRSLAHSVLFAIPLVLLVTAIAWRLDRPRIGAVFTLSYLSHLYGDSYLIAIHGIDFPYTTSLLWPLFPVPSPVQPSVIAHFTRVEPTPFVLAQLAFLIAVAWLYVRRTPTLTDSDSEPIG